MFILIYKIYNIIIQYDIFKLIFYNINFQYDYLIIK